MNPSAITQTNIWNQFFIWPITNILVAFYKFFESIGIPGPLGFAIIAMTILIKLVLWPLAHTQLKSAKKLQVMKPKIDELKKQHKDDKAALQKAQMELFKSEGYNPAAGCLPLLVQMPILFALYGVFSQVFLAKDLSAAVADINQILYPIVPKLTQLDLHFLGIDLSMKPSQWQQLGYWLLIIPVATAAIQWYQTKIMMASQQKTQASTTAMSTRKSTTSKNDEKKPEQDPDEMAATIQKQTMIIFPLIIGFSAYSFPVGLALYWNLFGIFGIIQQLFINKQYGKTN